MLVVIVGGGVIIGVFFNVEFKGLVSGVVVV